MATLSQEGSKGVLHYDPDPGIFRWAYRASKAMREGMIAGNINNNGEKRIKISGKSYASCRLAFLYMTGKFPIDVVKHIDGDLKNNRWDNLKDVKRIDTNQTNQKKRSDTKFLAGVSMDGEFLIAHITMNGKKKYLGKFDNIFDAACARKSANNKYGFGPDHGMRKQK